MTLPMLIMFVSFVALAITIAAVVFWFGDAELEDVMMAILICLVICAVFHLFFALGEWHTKCKPIQWNNSTAELEPGAITADTVNDLIRARVGVGPNP